jgi:hypothetical protein
MLPPEEYERAAANAVGHLQLEIMEVSLAPGEAVASGHVVRVFRGPAEMLGSAMSLRVPCTGPGDDDDWAPGESGHIRAAELRAGRVLEAYVDRTPAGLQIVLDLYAVIDSPTDTPSQMAYLDHPGEHAHGQPDSRQTPDPEG